MTRWLPYPILFAALVAFWLLLNQSISPGQILLGSIVAAVASWAMSALAPPQTNIKRFRSILHLLGRVAIDILHSNVDVAKTILGRTQRTANSGFLLVPLTLRDQYGLAALACIIAATPGTAWINYDSARSELLIHILNLHDRETWTQIIKQRYESLLLEIFE
jgi:multicomponent K+:H+ antiporter subunit E